ncbi:MAG: hypothetical protein ACTSPB_04505 [Candidatus Thorarchaeota archaeon]
MNKHNVTLTNGEAFSLRQAIQNFLRATPNLKGMIVYAMHLNLKTLNDPLTAFEKAQLAINNKYVEKDDDGKFKFEEVPEEDLLKGKLPQFLYTSEENKQKAIDEWQEVLDTEIKLELSRFNLSDFHELNINLQQCNDIGRVIDHCTVDNT